MVETVAGACRFPPFEDKLSSIVDEPIAGKRRALPFEDKLSSIVDEPVVDKHRSLPFQDKLSSFVDEPTVGQFRNFPTFQTFEDLEPSKSPRKFRLPFEDSAEFVRPPIFARGDIVERLLDDVSDIWSGGVILAAHPGGLYDVKYVDDHTVERSIEAMELRVRSQELNLPAEVWEQTGCYLHDQEELCAFECLSRAARVAAQRSADGWWRTAYHTKFGQCGGACQFEGTRRGTCVGPASEPRSWKERFRAREHRSVLWEVEEATWDNRAFSTTGQALQYSQIDGRLRYGQNSSNDQHFDPRLGCMVSDGL